MTNKTNRNNQCGTKGLLDLSMIGINRVFIPDYVIVEFAEEAMKKAHGYVRSGLRRLAKANPGKRVET